MSAAVELRAALATHRLLGPPERGHIRLGAESYLISVRQCDIASGVEGLWIYELERLASAPEPGVHYGTSYIQTSTAPRFLGKVTVVSVDHDCFVIRCKPIHGAPPLYPER